MVVARAHLVEQRRVDFDTEGFGRKLLNVDVERQPIAVDDEGDLVAIDKRAVLENVPRLFSLDRHQFVADEQASAFSWRAGLDTDDSWARNSDGGGHLVKVRAVVAPRGAALKPRSMSFTK